MTRDGCRGPLIAAAEKKNVYLVRVVRAGLMSLALSPIGGGNYWRLNGVATLGAAARYFDEYFAHWNIRLPDEALSKREPGRILEQGRRIRYRFDGDDKGEYLEVYLEHRMTNDVHVKVYGSGEVEYLPAISPFVAWNPNVPGDQERAERDYRRTVDAVVADLKSKGWWP